MPNSPSPAFMRLSYHSAYGVHTADIPTTIWLNTTSPGGHGVFEDHVAGSVDADGMIQALAALLVPFFPVTVNYDTYTIYTIADLVSPPIPRTSNVINLPGTSSVPGWSKATQATINWRTVDAGLFKIVLLDMATNSDFDPVRTLPGSGAIFDLDAFITDTAQGFLGRDNSRPATFIGLFKDINKKLRKAYRMN